MSGTTAAAPRPSGPPLISVIVPVRNDPGHLRVCLAGLRASTFDRYEIVVVNDASTDSTVEVAREFGVRLFDMEERRGPGLARNRGAEQAQGEILLFVDADVVVHPDTLARVAAAFEAEPELDALFGSYDAQPGERAFFAQYKNLFHHYVHQQGAGRASTFWAGCGAMRRAVFLEMGGFSAIYDRPCIEDIELGARMFRAGRRVALIKTVQATHLKRWTLRGILRSDVWDRGVPWTRLILREKHLPNDLNLKLSQRVCAALAYAFALALLVGAWFWPALLLLPAASWLGVVLADLLTSRGLGSLGLAAGAAIVVAGAVAAVALSSPVYALGLLAAPVVIVLLNGHFYAFFARERSLFFALLVVPMHVLYYLYSGLALAWGIAWHLWDTVTGSHKVRDSSLSSRTP
jgi:glycosyltransferase involved in cell wall biosynthesis